MECAFCNQKKMKEEILFSSDNFFIVPAVGSFVPYYLLLTTKKHIHPFGTSFKTTKINKEFLELRKKTERFYKKIGIKKWIYYEHGAGIGQSSGCCVDHAHIHLLPFDKNIVKIIQQFLGKPKIIKKYSELYKLHPQKMNGYLLVEENEKIFIWPEPMIVSQFVRRIIAEKINKGDKYDWKKYPFAENMLITTKQWKKIFP